MCGAHHGAPPSTPNWCGAHHGAPTIRHLGSLWRSEGGSSVQRMRWRRLRVQVTWFNEMEASPGAGHVRRGLMPLMRSDGGVSGCRRARGFVRCVASGLRRVIGTLRWSKLHYIGVSAVCGSRERSRERFRVSTFVRAVATPAPLPCRLACGVKVSARRRVLPSTARTSTKIKIGAKNSRPAIRHSERARARYLSQVTARDPEPRPPRCARPSSSTAPQ